MTSPLNPDTNTPWGPQGPGYTSADVGWVKSSFCAQGGCVEAKYVRASSCGAGSCVEVSYSPCGNGDCVEVARDGDRVLVRDSKLGDDSPVQAWPVKEWTELLRAIRTDSGRRAWKWSGDFSSVELAHDFDEPLVFSESEWDAFLEGVLAGDFEPGNLPRLPDPRGAATRSTPADEVAAVTGQSAAASAAGEELPPQLSSPAAPLVAAMNGGGMLLNSPAGRPAEGGPEAGQPGPDVAVAAALVDLCRPEVVDGVAAGLMDADVAREWAMDSFVAGAAFGEGVAAKRTAGLVDTANEWAKAIAPLVPTKTNSAPPGSALGRKGPAVVAAAAGSPKGSPTATSVEGAASSGGGTGGGEVAPVEGAGATDPDLCDSALLPLNSDPVEPCIKLADHASGDDKIHATAEGRRWRDPLDDEVA